MNFFKKKSETTGDGSNPVYKTKPKQLKRKKLLYWFVNVLIIIGLTGGYKSYTNKVEADKTAFDAVNFFNKQYITAYLNISDNQQTVDQNKKFIIDFTAVTVTSVTNDEIKSINVTTVENKTAEKQDDVYTTVNRIVYTSLVSEKKIAEKSVIYLKLKTKHVSEKQFVIIDQPSLQNFEYESVEQKEKEDIKNSNDKRVVLDGDGVPQDRLDAYKKNLTVFFDTYSKDTEKAETMVNTKLSRLTPGGNFDTEKIEFKDTQSKQNKDTVIVSVPYKTQTLTFKKIYKMTYSSNAVTAFEEIQ